jgi:hypothetical protein
MAIGRITDAQYAAVQGRKLQEFQARSASARVLNMEAVEALVGVRSFGFRGVVYEVPPIPATVGMRLQLLSARLHRAQEDKAPPEVFAPIWEEAATLAARCVRPKGWRRLFWRLRRRNPFRDATEGDLVDLLAFCLACRMSRTNRHAVEAVRPESTS